MLLAIEIGIGRYWSDGLTASPAIDIGNNAGTARECGSLERRGEARGQKQAMDALEDVHSVAPSARNRHLVHQSSPHSGRIVARKGTPEASQVGDERAQPINTRQHRSPCLRFLQGPPSPLHARRARATPCSRRCSSQACAGDSDVPVLSWCWATLVLDCCRRPL
jgi:hypothetical protein